MKPQIFYRYEWTEYASLDINGDYVMSKMPNPKLNILTFKLQKETPKGHWIGDIYKKWIPKESKKRYAYPTKEEALQNFIIRTKKRIKYLEHTLTCCEIAISMAEQQL